jgi:hypothetical protein
VTFILSRSRSTDPKLSQDLRIGPLKFGVGSPASGHFMAITKPFFPLHSHLMDPKLSQVLLIVPFEFGMHILAF